MPKRGGSNRQRASTVWRWLALVCVASALCWLPSANAQQARRIFLFEGLAPWQPGGAASLDAFRQRLTEKSPVNHEVYLDYLDLGRFPGKAHEERLVRFLGEKFAQNPPHLLVPNGPRSLSLLVRHRDAIAPGVPIVYCCAGAEAVDALNLPRDVLGVILEYNWAETLALAAQLQPGARNLVLISGASELDKIWRARALNNLAPRLQHYQVRTLFDMAYDDVLKELARLPRDTIVLQISIFADSTGRRFFQTELAEGVAAASSAPVYSAVSVTLGRGAVGGYMHSFEDQGAAAADIALDILAGKDPATLPRQTRPPHKYMADANALKRWDLDEAALPPGATILFKQRTVWDQYRFYIIGAFAVVLLQAALIAWLLLERDRRRRAAEQAGKARAESGQHRENLAHLVRVHMVGEMSTAIAHEVNQPLAAIKNYAFAARRRLSGHSADPKVEELLDKIEEQASRAGDVLNSLRAMVKKHDSERTKTEVGPLVSDALKLVEMESPSGAIRLESAIAPGLPPVFVDGIQIQQVVLNLIRNAIEAMDGTGHTGTVKVGVAGNGHGEIAVNVADSGPGIAPDDAQRIFDPFYSTKEAGLGVGLSISRAIIEAHGGRLLLTPNGGGGSVFRFTLPAMKEGH
jgi:signal transduction histidine kinase